MYRPGMGMATVGRFLPDVTIAKLEDGGEDCVGIRGIATAGGCDPGPLVHAGAVGAHHCGGVGMLEGGFWIVFRETPHWQVDGSID